MDAAEAANILRAGGLVAIPTETVYGLAANALDATAVARIFEVKGRPRTSPLIVHVDSVAMARSLVTEWPPEAQWLADRYWPGPLTMVLKKAPSVPEIVTAGLATVALRMPRHPVALDVIRLSGLPLAAPSANRFMKLSPTAASHVKLDGVPVVDGGACEVGIESTVVSLVNGVRLLRPGAIGRLELEHVLGCGIEMGIAGDGAHESPGMHTRHYSPLTAMCIVDGDLPESGRGAYLYWRVRKHADLEIAMPFDAESYAHRLYEALHEADAAKLDWIAVEDVPDDESWSAVRDRLKRAAGCG